ncbi:blue light receptor, partial [Chytridiales sp. JEL 0842]
PNKRFQSDDSTEPNNPNNLNNKMTQQQQPKQLDVISILSRVQSRPNPVIQLGPIDITSAFIIVDAQQPDMPIVYASDAFSTLTGYSKPEILYRNCRFLQSPDGIVPSGSQRLFTDSSVVYELKKNLGEGKEGQFVNVNYRKGGEPFVNLITVIPVKSLDAKEEVEFFVGFQSDVMSSMNHLHKKMTTPFSPPLTSPANFSDSNTSPAASLQDLSSATSPFALFDTSLTFDSILGQSSWDLNGSTDDDNNNSNLFMDIQDILPPPPFQPITSIPTAEILPSPPTPTSTHKIEILPPPHLPSPSTPDSPYHLLQTSPDWIFLLSSRGILLFSSPSSSTLLGFPPEELQGRNITQFLHASDGVSLQRTLKDLSATGHGELDLQVRLRTKKNGGAPGWVWVGLKGGVYHLGNRKGTKCFVLSGRRVSIPELPVGFLEGGKGLEWAKVSAGTGIVLDTFGGGQGAGGVVVMKRGERVRDLLQSGGFDVEGCMNGLKDGETRVLSGVESLDEGAAWDLTFYKPVKGDGVVYLRVDAHEEAPRVKTMEKWNEKGSKRVFENVREECETGLQFELRKLERENEKLLEELALLSGKSLHTNFKSKNGKRRRR